MKSYGLIGKSLSHSHSKDYFENKFKKEGLDCRFLNFDIDNLGSLREIISQNDDLQGFTVTYPYKKTIFSYLDFIDEEAREIGAVNVVKINPDRKLHGLNTDYIGFQGLLHDAIHERNIKKAFVCGSGGASEAVRYVLKKEKIDFEILSRKDNSYQDIKIHGFHSNELIINATPVGMYPHIQDFLDLPYDTADSTNVFIDLIYNPDETIFMKKAREHGAKVYNGLKMLYLQADKALEIWQK